MLILKTLAIFLPILKYIFRPLLVLSLQIRYKYHLKVVIWLTNLFLGALHG